jgi:hypothetical protein
VNQNNGCKIKNIGNKIAEEGVQFAERLANTPNLRANKIAHRHRAVVKQNKLRK